MGVVYLFRLAALVLATLSAIVVLGLAARTSSLANNLIKGVTFTIDYVNLGIAAGVMTAVPIIVFLLLDFTQQKIRATIIVEILWMALLFILFVITGALAFKDFNTSELEKVGAHSCDDLGLNQLIDICNDSHYLAIFAYVTAGILFVYIGAIVAVGATKYKRETSVWNMPVEEAEKV